MGTWRRKIVPSCPHCGHPAGPSFHLDPLPNGETCNGEMYLDIESGRTICRNCLFEKSVEGMSHHCDCGCVWTGGEVWQGMRTDLGRMGNRAWLRQIGIVKGTMEVTIIKRPVIAYRVDVYRHGPRSHGYHGSPLLDLIGNFPIIFLLLPALACSLMSIFLLFWI